MASLEIKALIFDVFGTCVDWRGGIMRAIADLAQRRGFTIDPLAFADAWRGQYQPAMERVRSGARQFVILDALHRENLEEILPRFGLTHLSEDDRRELSFAWRRLDPWPDTVAGLTRLKQRYIIAPQSNSNIALAVNMAKHGGLPWDCILGAEVVQAYKPQPQSYDRAVAILGLKPDQVMMVAAHNSDLKAAQSRGLRTGFVIRPEEHRPGAAAELEPTGKWDIVARDFVDLAAQVGA